MPVEWNKRKTRPRNIGIDDQLWAELGQLADQEGTDHTAVLRAWAEYAVRKPGARQPQRLRRDTPTG